MYTQTSTNTCTYNARCDNCIAFGEASTSRRRRCCAHPSKVSWGLVLLMGAVWTRWGSLFLCLCVKKRRWKNNHAYTHIIPTREPTCTVVTRLRSQHTHHYNFAVVHPTRREEALDGLVVEKATFGANIDVTAACQRLVKQSTLRCGHVVVLICDSTCDSWLSVMAPLSLGCSGWCAIEMRRRGMWGM